jgi:hypothetical protein
MAHLPQVIVLTLLPSGCLLASFMASWATPVAMLAMVVNTALISRFIGHSCLCTVPRRAGVAGRCRGNLSGLGDLFFGYGDDGGDDGAGQG